MPGNPYLEAISTPSAPPQAAASGNPYLDAIGAPSAPPAASPTPEKPKAGKDVILPALDAGWRHAARGAVDAAEHVIGPVNAVLGAPQRGVAGAVTAAREGKQNWAPDAARAMMGQDTDRYEAELGKAMGTDRLKGALNIEGHKQSSNPWESTAARIGDWGIDTAAQSLTDPTMLLPITKVGKLASKGLEALGARIPLTDTTRGVAREIGSDNARELQALETGAQNWAKEYVQAHPGYEHTEHQIARAKFQDDAEKHFNLRGGRTTPSNKLQAAMTSYGQQKAQPFQRVAKDRVSGDARDLLQQDPQFQHLLQHLDQTYMPQAMHDYLYARQAAKTPGSPLFAALRHVSGAMKDALFLNPIPHMKNVTTLAYEGENGQEIVARGLKYYAMQKTPQFQQMAQKLEQSGATANFFKEHEAMWDKIPGLKQWASAAHGALWNYDKAMRMGAYDTFKRAHPNWDDTRIAAEINKTLIDYAHKSPLADALSNVGAPFPHWRIQNPKRQAIAMAENPAAVERIARGEENANKELPEGSDYSMEFATPLDESMKAATNLPKYALSTMGPMWREPVRLAAGKDTLQDLAHGGVEGMAEWGYQTFGPMGGITTDLTANPFNAKGPGPLRGGLNVVGSYTQNAPSVHAKIKQRLMDEQNMDAFTADREATKYVRSQHKQYGY